MPLETSILSLTGEIPLIPNEDLDENTCITVHSSVNGVIEILETAPNKLHALMQQFNPEITTRYMEKNDRVYFGRIVYRIKKNKKNVLLEKLKEINIGALITTGLCLMITDFGDDDSVCIYEKSEDFGKKVVDGQGGNEDIMFFSHNHLNGYFKPLQSGNS